METQNSNQNPTAKEAAPATKDGGNSNQEVSSTSKYKLWPNSKSYHMYI